MTKKELQYLTFMLESNRIEGEDDAHINDVHAVKLALMGFDNTEDILTLHLILGKHLKKDWVGKWRKVQVYVGSYTPPSPKEVKKLMTQYCKDLPDMDSWKAHNEFEKIHPFQDLNGRVGRLIWLQKAVQEGYDFKLSFLHKYYYQTLSHYEL